MNIQKNHCYSYAEATDFFCIPRLLIVHEVYKNLSSESKIAYSLFLERMKENSHLDELNQNYIYYPERELAEILNVDIETVHDVMYKLNKGTGVGLIEVTYAFFEHHPRIYVKKFYEVKREDSKNEPLEVKIPPTAGEYYKALVDENYFTMIDYKKFEEKPKRKVITFPSEKVGG